MRVTKQIAVIIVAIVMAHTHADNFDDIFGGAIIKPGSGSGVITFSNKQTSFSRNDLESVARQIEEAYCLRTVVTSGEPVTSSVVIFVEENPTAPGILIAPEDGIARINVAKIKKSNEPADIVRQRVKKEILRTFGYLVGCSSQYNGNLLSASSHAELDKIDDMGLPVDLDERMKNYLAGFGIVRYIKEFYLDACEEGWAPNPTNAIQKAIWEKVHQLPTSRLGFCPKPRR